MKIKEIFKIREGLIHTEDWGKEDTRIWSNITDEGYFNLIVENDNGRFLYNRSHVRINYFVDAVFYTKRLF